MKLAEVIQYLSLEVCAATDKLDREVTGGHVTDLLSYVLANAKEG